MRIGFLKRSINASRHSYKTPRATALRPVQRSMFYGFARSMFKVGMGR